MVIGQLSSSLSYTILYMDVFWLQVHWSCPIGWHFAFGNRPDQSEGKGVHGLDYKLTNHGTDQRQKFLMQNFIKQISLQGIELA